MPTTAATVLAWAETWVRMSADEELLSGPLTDDQAARDRYGSSARQLRRLRQAVLSGALRQQAEQLGVDAPARVRRCPRQIRASTGTKRRCQRSEVHRRRRIARADLEHGGSLEGVRAGLRLAVMAWRELGDSDPAWDRFGLRGSGGRGTPAPSARRGDGVRSAGPRRPGSALRVAALAGCGGRPAGLLPAGT